MSDIHRGVPDWTDALQAGGRVVRTPGFTEIAARIHELERREALLTAVAEQLVEVHQIWESCDTVECVDVLNNANERLDIRVDKLKKAGFPWPTEPVDAGTEEAEESSEFGNCDECGEPLMFASMSTCARCSWSHEM